MMITAVIILVFGVVDVAQATASPDRLAGVTLIVSGLVIAIFGYLIRKRSKPSSGD
jgi:uncharacterized membrane protein YdcZ (DUF606 family)